MCRSMVDIRSTAAEIRRGKKERRRRRKKQHERKKERNYRAKIYMVSLLHRAIINKPQHETRMWANAQPDGRPAERSWRPLFNAAKFG